MFYTRQYLSNTNNKSSYLSQSWWGQSHCELLSNWSDKNLSHQYQNHQIWAELAAQAWHEFPIHKLCYWERSVGSLLKQEFHFQDLERCVHIHHLQKNENKSAICVHLQSFTGGLGSWIMWAKIAKTKIRLGMLVKIVFNTTPNTYIICKSILSFKIYTCVYSSYQVIMTDLTLHQDSRLQQFTVLNTNCIDRCLFWQLQVSVLKRFISHTKMCSSSTKHEKVL